MKRPTAGDRIGECRPPSCRYWRSPHQGENRTVQDRSDSYRHPSMVRRRIDKSILILFDESSPSMWIDIAAPRYERLGGALDRTSIEATLESCDRRRRVYSDRAVRGAVAVAMAKGASIVGECRFELSGALPSPLDMTLIVDQGPSAIERSRAEIIRAPRNDLASAVADRAIDAFDSRIHEPSFRGIGGERRQGIMTRAGSAKTPARPLPAIEKGSRIANQILDVRQMTQGLDGEPPFLDDILDMTAASPARPPVDGHRTRSANPHPTGKSIGEIRSAMTLHPRHDIQHGLVFRKGYLRRDELPLLRSAPNPHIEHLRRFIRRHAFAPLPSLLLEIDDRPSTARLRRRWKRYRSQYRLMVPPSRIPDIIAMTDRGQGFETRIESIPPDARPRCSTRTATCHKHLRKNDKKR